jgi:hypothetical protein
MPSLDQFKPFDQLLPDHKLMYMKIANCMMNFIMNNQYYDELKNLNDAIYNAIKPLEGGKKKPVTAKWVSEGRKVKTKSGEMRTLYRNSSTGKLCVKRMSTRDGKRVATYVKF